MLSNGTVRSWGFGGLGSVVVPANLNNVVKLAAGSTHALALKSDGTVTCLGQDSGWGETFPPAGLSNVLQVAGGYLFSAALLNDGTVRAWGRHDAGQTNPPAGLTGQKQIAAGGFHCLSLAYEPLLNYPVRPADDLLVIYNTNSAQSVALKDYYLAHRPLVGDAMTLGLGCQTGELFDNFDQMTNQLIKPVIQWLEANPTKRPEYYLLIFDIPSSYPNLFNTNIHDYSVQWYLREAVPVRKPMLSHLNMATLGDCTNYVNKLAFFGSNYSPGQVVISPRSGGYSNLTYQYSGTQCHPGDVALWLTTMHRFTGTSNQIVCRPVVQGQPTDATNVAGFFTGGSYSGLGSEWGTNGSVRFFGGSSWNIIGSGESYNGMWSPQAGQGSFQRWFERTAFGGTNYENAAVAAHSHTTEPRTNVTPLPFYWALWEQGKYFPIVVWNMDALDVGTPFSGSYQATGDPFIKR